MTYFVGKDYRIGARDYRMFVTNPVAMFINDDILQKELTWMERQKNKIIELECDSWENLYSQFDRMVNYAEWDDRDEGKEEFFFREVVLSEQVGLVFLLKGFHRLDELNHERASLFLELFAEYAYKRAMIGERMLAFLQTDNPNLSYSIERPPLVNWHFNERPPKRGVYDSNVFSLANATEDEVHAFLLAMKKKSSSE
jgi:hypothetical protein